MFYFNSEKFDFWEIYEKIKQFYPLGIRKDETGMYFSYPGLKKLEDIIIDNIYNGEHFKKRWEDSVSVGCTLKEGVSAVSPLAGRCVADPGIIKNNLNRKYRVLQNKNAYLPHLVTKAAGLPCGNGSTTKNP